MFDMSDEDGAIYSDLYKDAHGFRPRHPVHFDTEADFKAELDALVQYATDEADRAARSARAALVDYAAHLDRLRSTFGLSWKQAVYWDLQAHACELEGPADHQRYVLECHFYGQGVGLEASEALARSYFLEAA
ncbi:MAG: hypothetical protein CMK09_15870 [Ponticaulis sp.]|nr:hypothetical protein [Ponticaulis sp.]